MKYIHAYEKNIYEALMSSLVANLIISHTSVIQNKHKLGRLNSIVPENGLLKINLDRMNI